MNAELPCYRVVRWADHFENAGSRRYADLTWIPTPNRHDGAGFRRVISHDNGEALYGCWRLIVEVASKCPCRGLLASETAAADLPTFVAIQRAPPTTPRPAPIAAYRA